MNPHTKFLLICALGLALGYSSMAALNAPKPRAQAAMDLFTHYCLPFARGQAMPPTDRLQEFRTWPNERNWIDPQSLLNLRVAGRGCSISDTFQRFTPSEQLALNDAVAAFVPQHLPALTPDTNHGLTTWEVFTLWVEHPWGDPRRWGIVLSRFGDTDETTLKIISPRRIDLSVPA